MDIGTGVMVGSVWIFAASCALSRYVTGIGLGLSVGVAIFLTLFALSN